MLKCSSTSLLLYRMTWGRSESGEKERMNGDWGNAAIWGKGAFKKRGSYVYRKGTHEELRTTEIGTGSLDGPK